MKKIEDEVSVDSCVEELQMMYSNEKGSSELNNVIQKDVEDIGIYNSGTDINIDNMVNQLAQDMSEVTGMTVSDSTVLNNSTTTTDTSQLWD